MLVADASIKDPGPDTADANEASQTPSGDACPNDQASTESGQEDHLTLLRRTGAGFNEKFWESRPSKASSTA